MYSFITENMSAEERERFEIDLYEPLKGTSPDAVPQRVIDEEMSLFSSFASQNKSLGGA